MTDQLTDQMIKKLPIPEKGQKRYLDARAKGFGLRVTAKGSKAFFVRYWTNTGQRRLFTIGSFPTWTTKAARAEAQRLIREVDLGGDPLGEYQETRAAPTVNELLDRYAADYLADGTTRLRQGTQRQYINVIENHIQPSLGKMKVADVAYQHVDAMHQKISKTAPINANRTLAVLSKVFGVAIRWQIIDRNPCIGVEKNPEVKRKRYLDREELERLNQALATETDQQGANILRLMLLTGCRKGEAMSARWEQLDLYNGLWIKAGSETKQKTEHRAPLSEPAITLLRQIDEVGKYVFPANSATGHRVALNKTWARIQADADLQDVNMHDLRHTYASVLVSAGLSLPVIGALLGHSQPQTTARYAHLQDDPLRKATEQAGAILGGDNVVRLRE